MHTAFLFNFPSLVKVFLLTLSQVYWNVLALAVTWAPLRTHCLLNLVWLGLACESFSTNFVSTKKCLQSRSMKYPFFFFFLIVILSPQIVNDKLVWLVQTKTTAQKEHTKTTWSSWRRVKLRGLIVISSFAVVNPYKFMLFIFIFFLHVCVMRNDCCTTLNTTPKTFF
jgi:hypothetical protein